MMIQWWEHSEKGVTDGQTENTICGAAWSQLKNNYELENLRTIIDQMCYDIFQVKIIGFH